MAPKGDALLLFLVAVSGLLLTLIIFVMMSLARKFRRRAKGDRPRPIERGLWVEVFWSVIRFGLTMVVCVWGGIIFVDICRPPSDALDIGIVGREWRWK